MAKNDGALWLLLGGAVALYFASRTNSGEQAISEGADSMGTIFSGVRGLRNNNPGNIRKTNTAWQGLAATQNDSSFFQFASMEYGIRAIAVILMNYSSKYGLDTVQGIVNRWAPPVENATNAYIAQVADYAGVAPDESLDVSNPGTLFALVRGIIRQENGFVADTLVSDETVRNGIALALE